MDFTIVFTSHGSNGARRPGWVTLEDCLDLEDAVKFFQQHRDTCGVPTDAEIESINWADP
jgi:hypothetical protein